MTSYPLFDEAEVIVLGSGSAGCVAAIATARQGADTLLVERYGFLGGTSVMVLDTFYGFYTPGEHARRVVGGIPWEVVDRFRTFDAILERPNTYGAGTGVTYNPPMLEVLWEQFALESGVRLRLHTFCAGVDQDGERVTGLIVAGKSGLGVIRGRVVVDASGDADLCHWANAPYESAHLSGQEQSLTTTFRLGSMNMEQALKVKRADLEREMKEANVSGDYHPQR